MTPAQHIKRYLRSGEYDSSPPGLAGRHHRTGEARSRGTSPGAQHEPVPSLDLNSWTSRKVTPMVYGLFPVFEREPVLAMLAKSVVFVTSENVECFLLSQAWLGTAWNLANLYLASVDAALLGPNAPSLLGLSVDTSCYVSAD